MIKSWKKNIQIKGKHYIVIYTEHDYLGGSKMITSRTIPVDDEKINKANRENNRQ